MPVLILDNGAGSAKIGYASDIEPRIVPNCVTKAKNVRTRIFIGDQIDDCKDLSGLYYLLPFQKGYLVNWELERQVWDHMFGKDVFNVNFNETTLIVTEPYFNFVSIQEAMNEIIFEEYQFASALRTNSSFLSQYKWHKEETEKHLCSLIIDTGYSFSHILPYFKGKKLRNSIRRVNIGGKVLTNHLKEVISYRQLMVMDETHVMNQMKEDVCYVSENFNKDMQIARKKGAENTVAQDYVLPDYTQVKRGFVRSRDQKSGKADSNEQIIRMNNERFAIPELLFHPSDVGIQELGLPEAIVHTVNTTQEEMHPHLYNNICLTGGNCMLSGFKDRLEQDLRSLVPADYDIRVMLPNNPITYAWEGGKLLSQDSSLKKDLVITRQQFEEHGHNVCFEKFNV